MAKPSTVPRVSGDAELVTVAIAVTGGNVSAFARALGVHVSNVFAWRAGSRPLPALVARVCRVIIAHPSVSQWMTEAW